MEGYTRYEGVLKPDFLGGEAGREDGVRKTSGSPSGSVCSLLTAEENCKRRVDFHKLVGSRGGDRVSLWTLNVSFLL